MEKYFYPAIFHKAEEGGFWVSFPDFPECLTEGDDMSQAYEMACDALGLCISDMQKEGKPLPVPSSLDMNLLEPDSYVVAIQFNMDEYRRKYNNKAIKKTLSIPQWINEEAIAQNINFSQVLQEALLLKLGQGSIKKNVSYPGEVLAVMEDTPKYSK
ncbi:MAG: type II toxin-antitoxin system HicB family antitoxin [Treponema sp.]|nr:type II toxin-antitoxin system HicB family antitoxin [Treponema sp.]